MHQKLNGILVRHKLRVRYYNRSLNFLRLECKFKHGELVSKKSTPITFEQYELMRLGNYSFMANMENLILAFFYNQHLTKILRPVILVEYNREAFTYIPGNVRVTFDTHLTASLAHERDGGSRKVFSDDRIIVELKYDNFLPSVVRELFNGLPMIQLAISKYVLARENLFA